MSWPTVRLRRVARFAYGDSLAERDDGDIAVYGSNGCVGSHVVPNTTGPVLVIGRKGSFGKVQYSESPVFAIDTTFFVDARHTNANLRWLYYVLLTLRLDDLSEDVGVPGLSREKAYEQNISLPSPAQQAAIVDYLDREISRIDTLIATKRRMVELLEEGLVAHIEASLGNPTISGIPLRRLLTKPPQYGASESGYADRSDWPRYIRITDLDPKGGLRENTKRTLPPDVARPYLLQDWDILIARSGATVGKAFAYKASMGPCCFAGYLIRFCFDRHKISPGLVELWTRTRHYWSQIGEAALQATIENVSAEKYKDLVVPVPPLVDQDRLVATLSSHRDRTELVQSHLHKQMHLLVERRQTLITAAVTGQLDIAEAA